MPSTFPARDLDTPTTLANVLGSFWTEIYGDGAELSASLEATAIPWRQAARDIDATIAELAYATIPPLRVREWLQVTILESGRTDPRLAGHRYNDGSAYGDGDRYGTPAAIAGYIVNIGDVRDAPAIFDAISDPTVVLVDGLDYTVDPATGTLHLRLDPFADPRWSPTPVLDANGDVVDHQLTLWLWHAGVDESALTRRIGYALGVDVPSTAAARDMLAAAVSLLVSGSSVGRLAAFLSALADVPLCATDGERVAAVIRDARGLAIATDRAAYRFSADCRAVVAAGDVLLAGDPMVDGLRVDPLIGGRVPPDCAGLLLPPAPDVPAAAFVNRDVPLLLGPDDRVSWDVGLPPADHARFWADVRRREDEAGVRIAAHLGSPPPATINPLAFALGYIYRGGTILLRIRAAGVGAEAPGVRFTGMLRWLLPPHALAFLHVELPMAPDGGNPGGDALPNPQAAAVLARDASPSPAGQDDLWQPRALPEIFPG